MTTERKAVSFEELLGATSTASPLIGEGTHTCRKCNEAKPLTPDYWVPQGTTRLYKDMCRKCRDESRGGFARVVAENRKQIDTEHKQALVASTGKAVRKLEIARALRESITVANAVAKPVLDKLTEILADEAHPMHVWAFQYVVGLVMPHKLFAELGLAEAGLSDKDQSLAVGQRPTVSITITTSGAPHAVVDVNPIALPPAREGEVIDVEPVEVTEERIQ